MPYNYGVITSACQSIKSNHGIQHFFSTLHENEPTTPPRKRKRDTPTKKKSWTQGDLLQFQFQFTRTVPSSPNTDEETQEPLLPPSFEEMIQRKQAHKNRSLVKQSKGNSTYQQRLRQYFNKHSPTKTEPLQSKQCIPSKIRLERNNEIMLAFKRRFKRRTTKTPPTSEKSFQKNPFRKNNQRKTLSSGRKTILLIFPFLGLTALFLVNRARD